MEAVTTFIDRMNAHLAAPVVAASPEDGLALDCYMSGKTARATAAEIEAFRAGQKRV